MFDLFDFNHDGRVSSSEFAMGMFIMDDIERENKIDAAGLDLSDLEMMDEAERNEILQDAGLDPDDYDF